MVFPNLMHASDILDIYSYILIDKTHILRKRSFPGPFPIGCFKKNLNSSPLDSIMLPNIWKFASNCDKNLESMKLLINYNFRGKNIFMAVVGTIKFTCPVYRTTFLSQCPVYRTGLFPYFLGLYKSSFDWKNWAGYITTLCTTAHCIYTGRGPKLQQIRTESPAKKEDLIFPNYSGEGEGGHTTPPPPRPLHNLILGAQGRVQYASLCGLILTSDPVCLRTHKILVTWSGSWSVRLN